LGKPIVLALLFINLWVTGSAQLFPPQPGPPNPPRNIVGTPLLFTDWVQAKVLSHNELFNNDSLLYNFDLVSQKLLAIDKQVEYRINKKEFQSVTFYHADFTLTLEHVPVINRKDLFLAVIKAPDKYSLYEYMHVVVGAYSYYVWNSFYIVFPFPNMRFVRLNIINKKLIRQSFALSSDIQRLDTYYSLHRNDEPNAYFLKGLIEYLNQKE
jgi:hypothetical protein